MTTIVESHKGYGYQYPRTQREAGLEFVEWEGRMRVRLSWSQIAVRVVAVVLLALLVIRFV